MHASGAAGSPLRATRDARLLSRRTTTALGVAVGLVSAALSAMILLRDEVLAPHLASRAGAVATAWRRGGLAHVAHTALTSYAGLHDDYFHAAYASPVARHFTAGVFGGLICPLVALMGVESGRYGAIGFSSWFVLLAELCNSASVGLIAAAVWLPLYLRSKARVQADDRQHVRLPLARTLTTGVIIVAIGAAGLLAFFCKPQSRAGRAGFFGFRLMGLLGVLYWPQRPAQAGVQAAGSVVFERAMYALAGVCFMLYAQVGLLHATRVAAPWASAARELTKPSLALFLVNDAAATFATLLLFAAAEDGTRAAARMALIAPLLSPGAAAALYLAQCERRIIAAASDAPAGHAKTA